MATSQNTGNRIYSPREIARAAGVPESRVLAALGGTDRYVPHDEAVLIGRSLQRAGRSPFSLFVSGAGASRPAGLPFAVSSTLHAGLFVATVFLTTVGLRPASATIANTRAEPMPLIFVALPGPGGGGGGGGRHEAAPPPRAEREGRRTLSSPLPVRKPPKPIEPVPEPPPPEPEPVKAEPLPLVVAPVVAAPADPTTRPAACSSRPPRRRIVAVPGAMAEPGPGQAPVSAKARATASGRDQAGAPAAARIALAVASIHRDCFAKSNRTTPRTLVSSELKVKSFSRSWSVVTARSGT